MKTFQAVPLMSISDRQLDYNCKITSVVLDEPATVSIPNILAGCNSAEKAFNVLPPGGWNCREYNTPKVCLHKIEGDVRVFSSLGIILIGDTVVLESLYNVYPNTPRVGALVRQRSSASIELDLTDIIGHYMTSACAHMLAGYTANRNYFHYLYDIISCFEFIASCRYSQLLDFDLLLPACRSPFQSEILDLVMSRLSLSKKTHLVSEDSIIYATTLYYTTGNRMPYNPRPAYVSFMRSLTHFAADSISIARMRELDKLSSKVYFSRKDASPMRRVLNEDDIESLMIRNGYTVLRGRDLTVSEKIYISSKATVIAGQYGAGHTNMVFAPKGAFLLDIQRQDIVNFNYRRLAGAAMQRYACLVGEISSTYLDRVNDKINLSYKEWSVNIDVLQQAVDDISRYF